MKIQTVKISGQGYAVDYGDGVIWSVSVDGCGYDKVLAWLSEGNIPEPEFTYEELESQRLAELKRAKMDALTKIVVEVDGKAFDGNETARLNMISAIQASELLGVNDNAWKLADNSVATVTVADLKQALALAIQEVGRIVMVESIEEL